MHCSWLGEKPPLLKYFGLNYPSDHYKVSYLWKFMPPLFGKFLVNGRVATIVTHCPVPKSKCFRYFDQLFCCTYFLQRLREILTFLPGAAKDKLESRLPSEAKVNLEG